MKNRLPRTLGTVAAASLLGVLPAVPASATWYQIFNGDMQWGGGVTSYDGMPLNDSTRAAFNLTFSDSSAEATSAGFRSFDANASQVTMVITTGNESRTLTGSGSYNFVFQPDAGFVDSNLATGQFGMGSTLPTGVTGCSLSDLLSTLGNPESIVGVGATAIDPTGVTGFYSEHGMNVSTLPTPSPAPVALMGAAGLLAARRRREPALV